MFQTPGGSKRTSDQFEFTPIGAITISSTKNDHEQDSIKENTYQQKDNNKRLKTGGGSHIGTLAGSHESNNTTKIESFRKNNNSSNSSVHSSSNNSMSKDVLFVEDSEFEEDSELIIQPSNEKENTRLDNQQSNILDSNTLLSTNNKNTEFSNPIRQSEEDFHKLEVENYSLKVKINTLKNLLKIVDDQGQLDMFEELNDWKTKYLRISKDFQQLRSKYDEALDSKNNSNGNSESTAEKNAKAKAKAETDIQKQNELLRNLQEEMEIKYDEKLKLEVEKSKKSTRQELEHVYGGLADADSQKHLQEIHSLKKQNEELLQSTEILNEEIAKLNQLKQDFEKDVTEYLKLNSDLEKQLDSKSKENDVLNENLATLETKLNTSNQLKDDLSLKIEQLIANHERELDSKNKEFEKLDNQLEQLNQKINELTEENGNLRESRDDKIDILEKDYNFYKDLAEESQKNLQNERDNLSSKDKVNFMEIQNLQLKIDDLEKKIALGKSANQNEVLEQNGKVKSLENEMSLLEKELESNKKLASNLQNRLSESSDINSNLKITIDEKSSHILELLNQIEKLQYENSALKNTIKETKKELHILKRKELELLSDRSKWENETHHLKGKVLSFEKINRDLQKKILDKNDDAELLAVRKQLSELETEEKKLQEEIKNLKIEHKLQNIQISQEAQSEIQKLNVNIEALQNQLKDNSQLELLKNEFNQKYKILKDQYLVKIKQTKAKYIKEIKELMDENNELQRTNKAQSDTLERTINNTVASKSRDRQISSMLDPIRSKAELYELKYRKAVSKNYNLQFVNTYLSDYLNTAERKLKHDALYFESESYPSSASSYRYPPTPDSQSIKNNSSSMHSFGNSSWKAQRERRRELRKKFRRVGFAVLAVVKLKNLTRQSIQRDRKIFELEEKVMNSRSSW